MENQVTIEGFSDSCVWDVYLEANIETLKPKVLPSIKPKLPDTKTNRVAEILENNTKLRGLPISYQFLTDNDVRLQEHVQKWQKRFEQLYHDRRILGLVIPNEAGIPKFLSSTIRPSQLKYPEFFYWEGIVNFLPGFLKYEPLENPLDFPKYLPSPLTVLQWAKADSFDYSIVLVSLLLGVGYNAMCVCGYAPKDITTNNEKKMNIDMTKVEISPTKIMIPEKLGHHDKHVTILDAIAPKKFETIIQPIYNLTYLERKRVDRLHLGQLFVADFNTSNTDVLVQGQTDDDDTLINYLEKHAPLPPLKEESPLPLLLDKSLHDPLDKFRLHCWVIIFKGDREVLDTFYIESTTGRRYALDESPYQAIEFVWSPHNLWVNMQLNPKREGIANISWDFQNINMWESVLDFDQATPYVEDPSTDPAIAFGKKLEEEPVEEQLVTKAKKGEIIVKDIYGDINSYHWFLGLSWVPKLDIPIDNYVTRCPKGCKKTLYNHCVHLMFAFYGDYMQWDGLIERLLYFKDDNYKDLVECHDFYQRRKDMLKKRIYYLKEMKVQEQFGAGTTSGIKTITVIEGNLRYFEYYPHARTDGLQTREEIIGKQVTETYANTENAMIYRCVVYAPPLAIEEDSLPNSIQSLDMSIIDMTTEKSDSIGSIQHGSVVSGRSKSSLHSRKSMQRSTKRKTSKGKIRLKQGKQQPSIVERLCCLEDKKNNLMTSIRRRTINDKQLAITKITQKYSFRDDVKPSDNVAKRVFKIPLQQIRVDYHFVNGRITNNTKIYERDGSYTSMHVDPLLEKMEGFAQIDEFHHLQRAEKECIQGIREAEQDVVELLEQRAREEQCVMIMTPFSDIAQVKKDQDVPEVSKIEADYLSPYFPPGIKPRQHLTRSQMIAVEDNCMNALKNKLVARAAIIQGRHKEETLQLAKARANFERDREGMTVVEEEEYEKACEQAIFRIRILEERQAYHEEQSLKKYAEMKEKLRNDPRLHELYTKRYP